MSTEVSEVNYPRIKLFFMFSVAAWYSLYNPKPGLEMVADHNKARGERAIIEAMGRLFANRREIPAHQQETLDNVRSFRDTKSSGASSDSELLDRIRKRRTNIAP